MKQKIYILALECVGRKVKENYIQESGAAKKVGDTKYPRAACHAKMQNATDK